MRVSVWRAGTAHGRCGRCRAKISRSRRTRSRARGCVKGSGSMIGWRWGKSSSALMLLGDTSVLLWGSQHARKRGREGARRTLSVAVTAVSNKKTCDVEELPASVEIISLPSRPLTWTQSGCAKHKITRARVSQSRSFAETRAESGQHPSTVFQVNFSVPLKCQALWPRDWTNHQMGSRTSSGCSDVLLHTIRYCCILSTTVLG